MAKSWRELRAKMSPESQARVGQAVAALGRGEDETMDDVKALIEMVANFQCHIFDPVGGTDCRERHRGDVESWCSSCIAMELAAALAAPRPSGEVGVVPPSRTWGDIYRPAQGWPDGNNQERWMVKHDVRGTVRAVTGDTRGAAQAAPVSGGDALGTHAQPVARPSGEREAPADLVSLHRRLYDAAMREKRTQAEMVIHPDIEEKALAHDEAEMDRIAAYLDLLAWRPSPPGERPEIAALTAQLEAAQRERDKFVRLYERVEIDLFFMEERAQDAEAKLTAAQSERDSYKRQAHGASEALLETMRLREVETERACAAQSEAAALREALAGLVEQKHEPSEYYGVNDDMRCAFCGEDYIGHDRDEGARHTPACAWQAALALLAGQPAPEGRLEP